MDFFSHEPQRLFANLVLLPQEGATTDPTGRPPNSYAILEGNHSILVDAPFSWCMKAIKALADAGHPPVALVLTHAHVATIGDAFDDLEALFGVPVLMQAEDAALPEVDELGLRVADPATNTFIVRDGIEVIPMPGHTPGSIMLRWPQNAGVLLAGDSAVGPGPGEEPDPPRISRPAMAAGVDAAFVARWQEIVEHKTFSSILPLHGRPVIDRSDIGAIAAGIWEHPPVDPVDA